VSLPEQEPSTTLHGEPEAPQLGQEPSTAPDEEPGAPPRDPEPSVPPRDPEPSVPPRDPEPSVLPRDPEPSVLPRDQESSVLPCDQESSVPPRDQEPSAPDPGGEPEVQQRGEGAASPAAQWQVPGVKLTGRGAVLVMLVVFALGLLGASWVRSPVLAGVSFIVGSVAAVIYVRQRDLLMVTITPPLLFCIVLVGVKAGTASGNLVLSVAEGAAITLAGVAPWLFAGTALGLIIAWPRGLRACARELRHNLRPTDRRPGTSGPSGS